MRIKKTLLAHTGDGRIPSSRVGIPQWLEHQLMIERSQFEFLQSRAMGEFCFPISTFCADSCFGIRSKPMLLVMGHSAKCAGDTHAPYLRIFQWSDTVNWCIVVCTVWCTQNLCQIGSSFMWHQPCNFHKIQTALHWKWQKCPMQRKRKKNAVTHSESHMTWVHWVPKSRK